MHDSILEQVALSLDIPPQSIAASTAVNGAVLDMKGYNGVCFVLLLGAIDGTQDLKAQMDDAVGFGSPTDITGAAIVQVGAAGDNKWYALDVWRPTERFVRGVVTNGAGATADFQGLISIRYHRNGIGSPLSQAGALEATQGAAIVKVAPQT